jgi:putative ATPase
VPHLFAKLEEQRRRRHAPLAERMRPRSLDEVVGQGHLLGSGALFRELFQTGEVPSLILWGPPGSGKTTLARLLADRGGRRFVSLSATSSGVKDVREVARRADERLGGAGTGTLLFLDEIHRFTKAQQDALLPPVEAGSLVLVGATTENPGFEVIPALRSRARVLVLQALGEAEVVELLERALADAERGLGGEGIEAEPEALRLIYAATGGDARAALNLLELSSRALARGAAAQDVGAGDGGAGGTNRLTRSLVERAAAGGAVAYDKGGEAHFDAISALHKSVRGSDPDATLYWLARMLEGGEDPVYVARRLVRAATEDVGLADPQALVQANAAAQAVQLVGMPEASLALAQAAVYLAVAPKSNAIYAAYGAAQRDVRQRPAYPVPLHLRNAPTALMRELGYGAGYDYPHDRPDGVGRQAYLPEQLEGTAYYRPTARGVEERVRKRLETIRRLRGEAPGPGADDA